MLISIGVIFNQLVILVFKWIYGWLFQHVKIVLAMFSECAVQNSIRVREFKSAINLLLMVMVHTSIYVVESVCWETIYINNTLWAFTPYLYTRTVIRINFMNFVQLIFLKAFTRTLNILYYTLVRSFLMNLLIFSYVSVLWPTCFLSSSVFGTSGCILHGYAI